VKIFNLKSYIFPVFILININLWEIMRRYNRFSNIGDKDEEKRTQEQYTKAAYWIVLIIIGAASVFGVIAFGLYMSNNSSFLRNINGMPPADGTINLMAGDGLSLEQDYNTTTIKVVDNNVRDALRAPDDPNSTSMNYYALISGPSDEWLVGDHDYLGPGFFPDFVPGIYPGEDGQGNQNSRWVVPAPGEYRIFSSCYNIMYGTMTAGDQYIFEHAVAFNANSVYPSSGTAVQPWNPQASQQLTSGPNSAVVHTATTSITSGFIAGCPGCDIQVGDVLSIHVFLRHFPFSSPNPVGTFSDCIITPVRVA
jgi:hypothetical protein